MTTEEMLREQLARANQRIEALEAQIEAGERAARAADARLDEAAEFLREVYRTLPGAVMIIGDNGLIQAVNSGAAALLEYSEKELIGKPAAIVFDPENVPDVAEIEALALESRILRTELEYCPRATGPSRSCSRPPRSGEPTRGRTVRAGSSASPSTSATASASSSSCARPRSWSRSAAWPPGSRTSSTRPSSSCPTASSSCRKR